MTDRERIIALFAVLTSWFKDAGGTAFIEMHDIYGYEGTAQLAWIDEYTGYTCCVFIYADFCKFWIEPHYEGEKHRGIPDALKVVEWYYKEFAEFCDPNVINFKYEKMKQEVKASKFLAC